MFRKITSLVIALLFITAIAIVAGCTSGKTNVIELTSDKSNEVTLKPGQLAEYHNGNWAIPLLSNGTQNIKIDAETKTPASKIAIMLVDSDNYDKVSNGWTTYEQLNYPKGTYLSNPWSDTVTMPADSHIVLENDGSTDATLLVRIKTQ